MRKITLVVFVLGVILAAGVFLSENVSRHDAEKPIIKTPVLEPLAEHLSRATIPVSVSIAAVGEALERKTPKQESGSRKNSFGRSFAQSEINWNLNRSRLQVSGQSGALSIATEFSGEARATGAIQLARKIDFSASGDVVGSASLTASPTLETNWRVSPNLSEVKIDIQRADIPIKRIGNLNVRGDILPGIRITADALRAQLNQSVARSDFFEQAARKGWKRLCGSTPLGEDSDLWLETIPVVARATQIRIGRKNIRTTIGAEVKTRILTEQTQPECPFPRTLLLEEPEPGGFEIVMPAIIDYETLERTLAEEVVGKSVGKNISITIKAVSIHPYGEKLLLGTEVAVEAKVLSGTEVKGILYVVAEPELDAETQTITLENVALDIDSQNVLFSMAGKAAEPLLLEAVSRRLPFDLGPKFEELRDGAEEAISALSSENVSVAGKVRQVRITRLDVGPEHLRLVLTAEGMVRARVQAIP